MRIVYPLYALSGLISLVYQVVWFRTFTEGFGSTNLTFALVVANFIGGLGIGALASARIVAWLRKLSRIDDPWRLYGLVEVLIAAAVMLTPLSRMIPPDAFGVFPYIQHNGVFEPILIYRAALLLIAVVCVFVPCLLMGVTFPLLCQAYKADGRFPSALYAWNTAGACAGVLLCEFLLLPHLGHDATLWLMVGLNAVLGGVFLFGGGWLTGWAPGVQAREPGRTDETGRYAIGGGVLLLCATASGFLTGAIEGDVFKRLRFLGCAGETAMSFISFWAIVGIFLGSATVRLLPRLSFVAVRSASGIAFVLYLLAWNFAFHLRDDLVEPILGKGLVGILAFTGLFVLPAFYPLALLLPYVCNHVQASQRHLGTAYGANTVAFCVGIIAFTWVTPLVNIFYSLKLLMVVFAIVVALLLLVRATSRVRPLALAGVGAIAAAAALTPTSFEPRFFPPGSPPTQFPIRAMKSNAAHTTYIVEASDGDVLYFTHHPMSGTEPGAQLYMRLMAQFPLLAHPGPKAALLICFGVGNTAAAIATHDTIERIDIVDLNEKVFETAPEFAETNQDVARDPRVAFIHDDGRSFLARTDRKYDLVTSEPPPPQHEGVYRLYSSEFYAAVREHLTPRGMMSQWLPIFQMSPEAVDLAVRTFVEAFPHTLLFTGQARNYILVGGLNPIDLAELERRFSVSPTVTEDLRRLDIERPAQLLARIVQPDEALRRNYVLGHGKRKRISDQRNDLAHYFADEETRPAVVTYDPRDVRRLLQEWKLAAQPELESVLANLARLKILIPDFPDSALESVPVEGDGFVIAYAGAAWGRLSALVAEGRTAFGGGRFEEAAARLREATAIVPELPWLLAELGQVQIMAGDYDGALDTWTRHRQLVPNSGRGHYGSGYALLMLRRPHDALPLFEKSIALDGENVRYLCALGDTYAALGNYPNARAAFDRALAIDPQDPVARDRRARLGGSPP